MWESLKPDSPLFKNLKAGEAFLAAAALASSGAISTEKLGDYANVCLKTPGELDKIINPRQ